MPKIVACISDPELDRLDTWLRIRPKVEPEKMNTSPMVKTRDQCEAMSNRELREYIRNTLNMGLGDAKNKEDLLNLIFGKSKIQVVEKKETPCTIVLDGIQTLNFTYPKGKTQKDLVNHLYDFFD